MRQKTILIVVTLLFVSFTLTATARVGKGPRPPGPRNARQATLQVESLPQSHLCYLKGEGPLPAVIYNHGGKGGQIGGSPKETCEALAKMGVVGYAPIRQKTASLRADIHNVLTAVDDMKKLRKVDSGRLGIMGFSSGALLALETAIKRAEDFRAIILMAPAPGERGRLEKLLEDADQISAPVLILVAQNDTMRVNHVEWSRKTYRALKEAGKEVQLIEYPPFGTDGHRMFFGVGSYWQDVTRFLHLTLNPSRPSS